MHMTVTVQVRMIQAVDYDDAMERAFHYVLITPAGEVLLNGILTGQEDWWEQWKKLAKVAKEADGTFTVTIP